MAKTFNNLTERMMAMTKTFNNLTNMRDAIEDEATNIVKNVFFQPEDDETTYCAVDTLGIDDFSDGWTADVRCFVHGRQLYVGKIYMPTIVPSARMLGVYLAAYLIGIDDTKKQ